MQDIISLLDNALLQGLGYGIGVLGVAIAFRVVRYPDLTADGSFVLGAAVFASLLSYTQNWEFAAAGAMIVGGLAGLTTAALNATFGVSRLLTGILTSMIAYSLVFRILGGRPNMGTREFPTMFNPMWSWDATLLTSWGIHGGQLLVSLLFALSAYFAVLWFLKSEFGLFVRAIGTNSALVDELGYNSALFRMAGLALANALVALSGAVVSARQGFADVNMGFGVIIILVAALVIGEEIMRRMVNLARSSLAWQIATPLCGAFLYFLFYLLILRASIRGWLPFMVQPTDLKLISALVVISVVAFRRSKARSEEVLPLF